MIPLKAFSPGSITLFFSIRDDARQYNRKGSLGVGIVINKGALTESRKSSLTEVTLNGKFVKNTLQEMIIKESGIKAIIRTRTQLPISQGFGMSAAGAVSTSLSLFYGEKTYYECMGVAHRSEVKNGTGLGDVASISTGGFTLRKKEGIPPYGFVDRLRAENIEFVVLVMETPLETREIIKENGYRKKIIKAGDSAMEMFMKEMSLRNAFRVARKFSREISIGSNELIEIMEKAREYGEVAQGMIGNSLIAYGKNDSLEKIFDKYGKVFRVRIYNSLPRLIEENI